MNTRRGFLVFTLVVSLSVCALIYMSPGAVSTIATYAFIRKADTKTILYWNGFFGDDSFGLGEGYIAQHCPRYNNCWATHRRYLQNIDSYDAIVFHGINQEFDYEDVPARRKAEQRYVFVALESPANRYIIPEFDGFFNATMTYHLDSDVIWTYADVYDLDEEQVPAVPSRTDYKWKTTDSGYEDKDFVEEQEEHELFRMITGKRKLAVWYVSNCEAQSGRELYVNELERHAPIDKYGKCSGDTNCPKGADCFKIHVEPNYFFYLSFENSLCEDYVTEKFYNALK